MSSSSQSWDSADICDEIRLFLGDDNADSSDRLPQGRYYAGGWFVGDFYNSNSNPKDLETELREASPTTILPEKYVKVANAGYGNYGEVFFCLPKTAIAAAADGIKSTPPSMDMDKLWREICVVKVQRSVEAKFGAKCEVVAMEAIRASESPMCSRLAEILDADNSSGDTVDWIATSAIFGPTLCQVSFGWNKVMDYKPIPEEMVCHVFIQLCDALRFLHGLEQPIMHCDIHKGNIMLDPFRQDFPGLPNVVLIDFGNAKMQGNDLFPELEDEAEAVWAKRQDLSDLCDVLWHLATWKRGFEIQYDWNPRWGNNLIDQEGDGTLSQEVEWNHFHQFLFHAQRVEGVYMGLERIWQKFSPMAFARRAACSAEVFEVIEYVMTSLQTGMSDEDISRAVEIAIAEGAIVEVDVEVSAKAVANANS
ncbi:kinase-like protein [Lepidopterella palustris CBS 459.81]|uniref:non-specific serine/threonine protein kinase n=1 Tax=Lepidopterella palustris CBS 459.81 TaxID=1314670 RepID=A0A8E2DYP8_9PEZI|nr:kinase-like protein [Lepidopterella palustris CBS 459.81]